jgi:hypothetical protein
VSTFWSIYITASADSKSRGRQPVPMGQCCTEVLCWAANLMVPGLIPPALSFFFKLVINLMIGLYVISARSSNHFFIITQRANHMIFDEGLYIFIFILILEG